MDKHIEKKQTNKQTNKQKQNRKTPKAKNQNLSKEFFHSKTQNNEIKKKWTKFKDLKKALIEIYLFYEAITEVYDQKSQNIKTFW